MWFWGMNIIACHYWDDTMMIIPVLIWSILSSLTCSIKSPEWYWQQMPLPVCVNLCLVFWDLDLRQRAGKESAVVPYYCKWMEQPGVSGWISLPLDIRMGLWEGPEPQYNERRKPQLPWQLHKYTETISTLSNIKQTENNRAPPLSLLHTHPYNFK